ncbi:FkbM family methyltransferase [Nocardioides sp.]|uniref:FkbM family methyltransferase n=1 Tax=Nocardioides sp. TaxID=35761 RepID=UPI0027355C27|nr:FkbM family methyltransferase [Nocardioides sp.]MDP3892180.1 FkbM family methyltransferase [Nocardioides sp.]
MITKLRRSARRVGQTMSAFDNGTSVLAGMAGNRLRGRPEELTFRLPGAGSIICPNRPGARVPVYEVFAEDAYRLEWFLDGMASSPGADGSLTALDIGGHIGCFAVAFARTFPGSRVDAYEASPTTAAYLSRNITANGLDDRVRCHPRAVSAERGTLEFADNAAGSALNGLTAPRGAATVQVEAITFADAVAAAGGAVDVVKIDTEGAEYDIVLGSAPADWSGVRRVVLEYHDVPGHGRKELEDFFTEAGLTVIRHEPVAPNLGTLWLSRG